MSHHELIRAHRLGSFQMHRLDQKPLIGGGNGKTFLSTPATSPGEYARKLLETTSVSSIFKSFP